MKNNDDKDISKTNLEAFGWNLSQYVQATPFESHFFYLCDYRSGKVQLMSVKQTTFEAAMHNNQPIGVYVDVIARLIKKDDKKKLSPKESEHLMAALVAYIKCTGTYRQWNSIAPAGERLHALINIYKLNGGDSLLRPLIIRHNDVLLRPEDITAYSRQFDTRDKSTHPEWFM